MKKDRIFAGIIAFSFMILTACAGNGGVSAGGNGTKGTPETKTAEAAKGMETQEAKKSETSLNALFIKQAGYSEDDITAMTKDFEASNPGIKVNLTFVASEELEPKILTAAKTGGYDVVLGDCIWPAQFAKSGLVLDITDRVKTLDLSDVYEGAMDSTKYEGKYYGLPWLNDVKYMFYNKAMLSKAGIGNPPKTWDEVIADSKIIKEKNICEYPIAACFSQAECLICDFTVLSGCFDGNFVDQNNKPTLNTAENKKALQFMADNMKNGIINPKSLEMIEDDVLRTFVSGNAAFALNWTYMYAGAKDKEKSQIANDVGIMTVPGEGNVKSATVNGGQPLMITSGSQHPDEAWTFMTYIASKDIQKKYCKNALPMYKSLYSDKEVIETSGQELVNISQTQYQYIKNRPQVPYYAELTTFMQSKIQGVLLGSEEPGAALDEIQKKAEELALK